MNPRNRAGLTWVEVVVAIFIVCFLIALTFPVISDRPHHSPMYQTLANMRQLHLATQIMALDGVTTGDTNLGWPGNTGGTFDRWVYLLVASNYVATNDLYKLLTAPGKIAPSNHIPRKEESALLVYAVREEDDGTAVFLTTANFTNSPSGGSALSRDARPYGDKGFVVFRKGGDGAMMRPNQVGKTNIIGKYVPPCQ